MRCYLIRETQVTVLAEIPSDVTEGAELIESVGDLDQHRFPVSRLVDIWNALPGAEPVKRFRDRQVALRRVWAALEVLRVTSIQTESKQARVVALLQRPGGATMDDLTAATGWQRHSVRGVLSGVIRKKLGMAVTSAREGEQRVYRVVA
ncbi:MAG: DUF3489 domain-containing protein [Sinimarinibacterium flocculans]|uniref:DUF3489 domain-containing protein n=1 Tax=Sinimarinibacterium flocculans TaxID=985250 RepID=UPI003C58D083